jgi:hypothetical protein
MRCAGYVVLMWRNIKHYQDDDEEKEEKDDFLFSFVYLFI